jgi:hypothetical protein
MAEIRSTQIVRHEDFEIDTKKEISVYLKQLYLEHVVGSVSGGSLARNINKRMQMSKSMAKIGSRLQEKEEEGEGTCRRMDPSSFPQATKKEGKPPEAAL